MNDAALQRLRWAAGGAGVVLVALLCGLAVLATVQARVPRSTAAGIPAPMAIGTELPRPRRLPALSLVNAQGRPFPVSAWRGKWVVLAPSMTLCQEVCPMTSGVLMELQQRLRAAGLSRRVVVAEATVDPWRDTPARLRAYQRMTGVDFPMLTGSRAEIAKLWAFFGVYYAKVPAGAPAAVDWLTHRRESFDVDHTDAWFIIDPQGQERIVDDGIPQTHGPLPPQLRRLLDAQGRQNLAHPRLPWTAAEVVQDLDHVMGRSGPGKAPPSTTPPNAAQLRGSPASLALLHRQAGQLLGGAASFRRRLAELRGHPAVINVWASWCPPCRQEFPLFAAASVRYGRAVAFLGVDTDDAAGPARAFLAGHPVRYPSYQLAAAALSSLAVVAATPTTIFLNRTGRVVGVHTGQYSSATTLDEDIARYAFGVVG